MTKIQIYEEFKYKENKDIPEPFPFPPQYPSDIELGLRFSFYNRNKFASRNAKVMLLYKWYPKFSKYERVAQEVIRKYPLLESPTQPYVSLNKTEHL